MCVCVGLQMYTSDLGKVQIDEDKKIIMEINQKYTNLKIFLPKKLKRIIKIKI